LLLTFEAKILKAGVYRASEADDTSQYRYTKWGIHLFPRIATANCKVFVLLPHFLPFELDIEFVATYVCREPISFELKPCKLDFVTHLMEAYSVWC